MVFSNLFINPAVYSYKLIHGKPHIRQPQTVPPIHSWILLSIQTWQSLFYERDLIVHNLQDFIILRYCIVLSINMARIDVETARIDIKNSTAKGCYSSDGAVLLLSSF